ncbi:MULTISPECIES: gas vesicle protein GvpF [Halobacterium]|uniref:gas vesicle protein GvpF n=1 Tax=Halobacterium TaxID=2239 RepID=UPI001962E09D|nr:MULTISPECIES: GvpL/GvpF family gas vesicle protein [Halobacterium]MCF2164923.1 gas vesicle protein GvpF [Halobacterium salinarum]MCF2168983.1 gas vesicle protein GvpF [Halobacterium salinarum]MCF2237707.1 gas vesicle protein GvpF [Halobacterium salinarum]MDL0132827.1 gas vesicle protein GvpF [Halobacterium salinarum]MDL0135297.1 gas vesicle protein GvpF [Halobacterium salinarum]
MSESHLYTYGIIDDNESLALNVDGVAGATRAYTVSYRSLSAVVSDIETTDPERTDAAVEAHNTVLQAVLEHDATRAVVPMSFGMAFKNARTLKGVLRGARRALRSTLTEIAGTVELGVKVLAPGDDTAVDTAAVRSDVTARLSALSVGETENDCFTDRLIINKSYLVEHDTREAFDAAIDEIDAAHDDLTVRYTGPWPPYNFVDIHIGAEQAQQGGR